MSKKRGTPADAIYASHMFGNYGSFNANSGTIRESAIAAMLGRILTDLAANRFKWDGLPESVDPRFLELCLFYNGLSIFYKDFNYDKLLAVKGAGFGYNNVLDNPTSFSVVAPGQSSDSQFGYLTISAYNRVSDSDKTAEEKQRKAIPIWANYLRKPDHDIVNIYATRLATADRTLEINSKNARRTKVIKGSQQTNLSLVNIARQVDAGEELIQLTGPLQDMDFMDVLDLGIDGESFDKLSILRGRWWNECMTLLGIDAANQDKKERLVVAEVGANDSQADSIRFVNLQARQFACEQINEVFGLEVSVDYNIEVEQKAQMAEAQAQATAASDPHKDEGSEE